MLYFRTKPDSVFLIFVDHALRRTLKDIQRVSSQHDMESWELGFAELERVFTPYSAVITLEDLIKANSASQVYMLTDYHWLLLYDSLKNYCIWHNDTLEESSILFRLLGGVRFGPIDWEVMMERYFWDLDFLRLLYGSLTESLPSCNSEYSEISGLDLSHGLSPHPSLLRLELVEDQAWRIPEPLECGQWRLP